MAAGFPVHEIVGEVIHSRDDRHRRGDTVVGWASRTNGISEYLVTEGVGLTSAPLGVSPAAAIVMQPLACVLNAVARLTGIAGSRVAVLGPGPIGTLVAHVLNRPGLRT